MKLFLAAMTPGAMCGKQIAVRLRRFLVGRGFQCHLRPSSLLVSNLHCALSVRDGSAFVEDLGSTNGTFLNGAAIQDESQLHDQDLLQVGPLDFTVRVETSTPVNSRTPLPATRVLDGGSWLLVGGGLWPA